MPYKYQPFQRLLILLAIFSVAAGFGFAQDKKEIVAEEPVVMSIGTGNGVGNANSEDEDDTKITGATVRGRVVYEDTGRPVRYALVTLVGEKSESYSNYSLKYVKTDENGEFVIKNVKAGTYIPYIKSEGILNQDSYNFSYRRPPNEKTPADLFEKITVSGLAEFQITSRQNAAAQSAGESPMPTAKRRSA